MIRSEARATLSIGLAVWALLVVGWLAYRPGLTGSFLFDDWINLPPLGAHGPIDNFHALVTYLLSGIASATGRPIAMLSFLIDANDWPAAPEPFKYTNILIHLLNGALLAWLAFRIARVLGATETRSGWTAVLSAGLWMLNPLMVSTTLFVVQRMVMLSAMFVLCGLLCYVHGRTRLANGRTFAGYGWMTGGIVGFGLLAVLSKENGALLPLFALLLDALVLQHRTSAIRVAPRARGRRVWNAVFLYAPLILLASYLLAKFPDMLREYADVRTFTLGGRLLTEARIMVSYLYLLIIPHSHTGGLFNDNIAISTSLFHPWTTLPAITLLASLVVIAVRARTRYPLLSFGIAFYFAGHLLESTFIPLELYFEHRNYLPAMFLPLPLAYWLTTPRILQARLWAAVGVALLAVLAGFTWARASLWGHPFEQAAVWAQANPDSPRAQTTFALHLMRRRLYPEAARILQRAAGQHPNDVMLQLNLITAQCALGGVSRERFEDARTALLRTRVGSRVAYNAISKFLHYYKTAPCRGLSYERLDQLVGAALENPHVRRSPGWLRDMTELRGELRLAEKQPEQAVTLFKASLDAAPDPEAALYEAALLGSDGYQRLGLDLLDHFEALPPQTRSGFNVAHLRSWWLRHIGYYQTEATRLRTLLREDAASKEPIPSRAKRESKRSSHTRNISKDR